MSSVPYSSPLLRTRPFAVVLALALLLAACGGGGKKHGSAATTDTTTPKVLSVKTSVLKVATVNIQTAGPSTPIDTPTGRAVLGVAQSYIDDAVFAPLKTGEVAASYPTLFDTGLKAAATGSDEAALTDSRRREGQRPVDRRDPGPPVGARRQSRRAAVRRDDLRPDDQGHRRERPRWGSSATSS